MFSTISKRDHLSPGFVFKDSIKAAITGLVEKSEAETSFLSLDDGHKSARAYLNELENLSFVEDILKLSIDYFKNEDHLFARLVKVEIIKNCGFTFTHLNKIKNQLDAEISNEPARYQAILSVGLNNRIVDKAFKIIAEDGNFGARFLAQCAEYQEMTSLNQNTQQHSP